MSLCPLSRGVVWTDRCSSLECTGGLGWSCQIQSSPCTTTTTGLVLISVSRAFLREEREGEGKGGRKESALCHLWSQCVSMACVPLNMSVVIITKNLIPICHDSHLEEETQQEWGTRIKEHSIHYFCGFFNPRNQDISYAGCVTSLGS